MATGAQIARETIAPPSSLGGRIATGHDRAGATMRRRWGVAGLLMMLTMATGPADARHYSPWSDSPRAGEALIELAQRQDRCCKHCTKGQPCGNTRISAKARCKSPPGAHVEAAENC